MRAAVVVPTIREGSIRGFLDAWALEFNRPTVRVFVVEDNPQRTFKLPTWVSHAAWSDIESDLGEDACVIPRRSGAIRSYGILQAARTDTEMIVCLDDDCLPNANAPRGSFLADHEAALQEPCDMVPVFDTFALAKQPGIRARGYPSDRQEAKTVLNHGLWNNVPDLDGTTQMLHPTLRVTWSDHSQQVPRGVFFPMSAMNIAFRPEVAAAMYQLPMGQGYPYHRFDDIWCGWIAKRAFDAMRLGVRTGGPAINHVRASDPQVNADLEAPGKAINDQVLHEVAETYPPTTSLDEALAHIHSRLAHINKYWGTVNDLARRWRSRLSAGVAA